MNILKKVKHSFKQLLKTSSIVLILSFLLSCIKEDDSPSALEGNHLKSLILGEGIPALYFDTIQITRANGKPAEVSVKIGGSRLENFQPEFSLHLINGDGTNHLIGNAVLKIDGKQIIGPSDFENDPTQITLKISGLKTESMMEITVRGEPDSYIEVWIEGKLTRNKYDGLYEVTGSLVDLINPNISGFYPFNFKAVTSGEHQCIAFWVYNTSDEIIGHPTSIFGSLSYYGAFGLVLNFNPSGSGKILSVTNYYGQPASNTRSASLDPSGDNRWDSSSKNINIKYFMNQPSLVPSPPYIRVKFDENWRYLGPR